MPTLNGPITADGGALVNVFFGVSGPRRHVLVRLGFPVPAPPTVQAVLDTGSFITLADARTVALLGVTPYDQRKFFTSTTGVTPHVRDVYNLSVTLMDGAGIQLAYWPSIDVLPAVFPPNEAVHGVIGRDLLATTVLLFDGRAGTFNLTV